MSINWQMTSCNFTNWKTGILRFYLSWSETPSICGFICQRKKYLFSVSVYIRTTYTTNNYSDAQANGGQIFSAVWHFGETGLDNLMCENICEPICVCVSLPPLQRAPSTLCCWRGPTWKWLCWAESEITENLQNWSLPTATHSHRFTHIFTSTIVNTCTVKELTSAVRLKICLFCALRFKSIPSFSHIGLTGIKSCIFERV